VGACECHEWFPVVEIADWVCGIAVASHWKVRDRAAMPEIWEPGNYELSHEELTVRILAVDGIDCEHALEALTHLSGEINLLNGLHRWAVASELGISEVPVKMLHGTEPAWA
jgi:hypothetical protein